MNKTLAGAELNAFKFIRRLRPWAGGNQSINRLHALDIVDKHRLLLVVGTMSWQIAVVMKMRLDSGETIASPSWTISGTPPTTVLRDGDEVFRIAAAARNMPPVVDHAVIFHLAFGDDSELHPLDFLEQVHSHVSKIVEIAEHRLLSTATP